MSVNATLEDSSLATVGDDTHRFWARKRSCKPVSLKSIALMNAVKISSELRVVLTGSPKIHTYISQSSPARRWRVSFNMGTSKWSGLSLLESEASGRICPSAKGRRKAHMAHPTRRIPFLVRNAVRRRVRMVVSSRVQAPKFDAELAPETTESNVSARDVWLP
jgi:hypothetical protein